MRVNTILHPRFPQLCNFSP